MFDAENIPYPGAVKPNDTVLVVFIDASERAFGACAYVQWKVTEGEFSIKSIDPKKRNTEKNR